MKHKQSDDDETPTEIVYNDLDASGSPSDDVVGDAPFENKIKALKSELETMRKERDDYLAGWQRAKADYVNARRDEERERDRYTKYAKESVLQEFLGLADSLDMALRHGADENIMAVHRQLIELLKRHGISAIDAIGLPFHPAEHEALKEIPVDEEARDGVIIEEFQKGYRMHDKVLRPAKVGVGKYTALS
jgi:molecular chaperone GrpE (heat shock protein)